MIPPEKVYYRFNFCFYQCLPSPIEILTSPRLDLRWPAGIHSGGVLTCWDMAFLHRACTSFVSSKLEAWARMKSLEKNATSPQCRQHRIGSNYLDGFAALGVRQRCNNGSSAPTFHAQRCQKLKTVPLPGRSVYTSSEVLTSKAGFSTFPGLAAASKQGGQNRQASTERIGFKGDLPEPQHMIQVSDRK